MKRGRLDFELRRKLFHFFFGLFLIFILIYSGRRNLIIFLSIVLIMGCIMIVLMQKAGKFLLLIGLKRHSKGRMSGFPAMEPSGMLWERCFWLFFWDNADEIAAAIVALAAGDSAATIFGIRGRHPLPYNRRKTVEGSVAFFVFSLPACLFVGWMGVALAAIAAAVESLATPVDDNLLIPITAILFFIII